MEDGSVSLLDLVMLNFMYGRESLFFFLVLLSLNNVPASAAGGMTLRSVAGRSAPRHGG